MTEPAIFPAIGGVIAATTLLICKFYGDGKKLEERTRMVVSKKAEEVDAALLKANARITWDIWKGLMSRYGEEMLKALFAKSAEVFKLMHGLDLDKELDIEKLETPPEEFRIKDESRDPLIRISLLAAMIRRVPGHVSRTVNNMVKSIILGVILAVLVSLMGLSIPPDLRLQVAYISTILGILYFYLGPYQIWRLRNLETQVLKIEESKKIGEIERTLMETMR
jgi:hypothetical protein